MTVSSRPSPGIRNDAVGFHENMYAEPYTYFYGSKGANANNILLRAHVYNIK